MAAHPEPSLQGCEAHICVFLCLLYYNAMIYFIFVCSSVCCITMQWYIRVFLCLLQLQCNTIFCVLLSTVLECTYMCIPQYAVFAIQYYIFVFFCLLYYNVMIILCITIQSYICVFLCMLYYNYIFVYSCVCCMAMKVFVYLCISLSAVLKCNIVFVNSLTSLL